MRGERDLLKRVLVFIIILAFVTSLSYTLFAANIFSDLFGGSENDYSYAYSVDKHGNMFYVQNTQDGGKYLVGVDTNGQEIFKKNIASVADGNSMVDSLYIAQDHSIFMAIYHFNGGTKYFGRVTVEQFDGKGNFKSNIFTRSISEKYDGRYRVVSSFSDDNKNTYFAFFDGSNILTYSISKGVHQQLKQKNTVHVDVPLGVKVFLALPSGDVLIGTAKGEVRRLSVNGNSQPYTFPGNNVNITSMFWYAGGQLYCRDGTSGDLYSAPTTGGLTFSCAMQGNQSIPGSNGILFSQFNVIALGETGDLVCVCNSDNGNRRIFSGGLEFLTEISNTGNFFVSDLTEWVLFAVTIAGIIIVSLLAWDVYCNVLHMQTSLLVRQTLLVFFVIYLPLFTLYNGLIKPKMRQEFTIVQENQLERFTQMFLDGLQSLPIESNGQFDSSKISEFCSHYTQTGQKNDPLLDYHVFLFGKSNNTYALMASGENEINGWSMAYIEYVQQMGKQISGANKNINSYIISSREGDMFCTVAATDTMFNNAPVILCVVTPVKNLDLLIVNTDHMILFYLRLIGVSLLLLVLLIECLTAVRLIKLRIGVDKIAAGNYDYRIQIHSGDEIESLSKSIMTLASNIKKASQSLTHLNSLYYRFVPQEFLKMIGETHIEKVQTKSQACKKNAVMLFLRFRFASHSGENSEQIFANINEVFECIVPVVHQNNGMEFNFLPDGFNVVFENEPEQVLQSAFHIRESIDALNKERTKKHSLSGNVDVRIFITVGDIMLGFVGDETRMEPTAISDETQKAELIEKICYESSIYVACTRNFYKLIPTSIYRSRSIGEVAINQEKIQLFEFYDSDPYALVKIKDLYADQFALGVNLFAKGNYQRALGVFMDIMKYSAMDGVTRHYAVLSEYNMRSEGVQSCYTTDEEFEKLRRLSGK